MSIRIVSSRATLAERAARRHAVDWRRRPRAQRGPFLWVCPPLRKESPTADDSSEITGLLHAWHSGDAAALERIMPLVYAELQSIARRYLKGETGGHTLQTTALVHEAYLRLVGSQADWQDRRHFYAIAATTMRRILVDHARAHRRVKRHHGEAADVSLDAIASPQDLDPIDILALDDALTRLAAEDPRKAQAIELHYFAGLSYAEMAESLGVAEATVHRDLRFARAWLRDALGDAR